MVRVLWARATGAETTGSTKITVPSACSLAGISLSLWVNVTGVAVPCDNSTTGFVRFTSATDFPDTATDILAMIQTMHQRKVLAENIALWANHYVPFPCPGLPLQSGQELWVQVQASSGAYGFLAASLYLRPMPVEVSSARPMVLSEGCRFCRAANARGQWRY